MISRRTSIFESKEASLAQVEISSLACAFNTNTFGSPDVLFLTLLEGARESLDVAAKAEEEADRRRATLIAENYMAGLLLREAHFSTAVKTTHQGHHYSVDFNASILKLQTKLFATDQGRSSFFSVDLSMMIREGAFVVRNPVTHAVLLKGSEDQIRTPDFFTKELPLRCYQGLMDQERRGTSTVSSLVEQSLEMRFTVPAGSGSRHVMVRKRKGDTQWYIVDGDVGGVILTLPLEDGVDLAQLIESLPELLRTRPAAPPAGQEQPINSLA